MTNRPKPQHGLLDMIETAMWRCTPLIVFASIALSINSDHPRLLGYKLYPAMTRNMQTNINLGMSIILLFFVSRWANNDRASRKERQKKRTVDQQARTSAVARVREARAEKLRKEKSAEKAEGD